MTGGQYTIVLQNQDLRKLMTPIGQFIFRKRHALSMTQSELAQKSGVDGSYINRIEKGGKRPGNLIFLERLAKSLQFSSEEEKNYSQSQNYLNAPFVLPPIYRHLHTRQLIISFPHWWK